MLCPPSKTRIEVGVDEVGRGCLSHSVVAGACVLPQDLDLAHPLVASIKDSKKLSEKKRVQVCAFIKSVAVAWAVGEATVDEIDEHNILKATFMAMHRALDKVYAQCKFGHILVDGPHFRQYFQDRDNGITGERYFIPNTCVLNGDAVHMSIAAASILAKCYRDDMVCRIVAEDATGTLAKYGFESHKGYGTKKHMDALNAYGATLHHRKSFAPVAAILCAGSVSRGIRDDGDTDDDESDESDESDSSE